MADVFISYAREDRETARRLAEHIEKAGGSVWWDRSLLPGDRFSRLIRAQLEEAGWVIVLWSESSVDSDWVEAEAGFAREADKLVPALIEDVRPRIPLEFVRMHAADLTGWSGDASHPELLSLLEAVQGDAAAPDRPAVELSSPQVDVLLKKGHEAYKRRDFQEASRLLESALSSGVPNKRLAATHTSLGNAYRELHRLDDAIAAHQQALIADPGYHKAWVNLGITHRVKGDLKEAESCYKRALDLEPHNASARVSLAALYLHKDDTVGAMLELQHALANNPKLPVAHANLALAQAKEGNFRQAEESLRQAVKLGYPNEAAMQKRIDAER